MNHAIFSRALRPLARRRRGEGFTLIELMVTVAIIGILAGIALPVYRNYVIRGKLVEGTNGLASLRTLMEQYYQDNRTYQSITSSSIYSPCAFSTNSSVAGTFTLSCTSLSSAAYVLQAKASSGAATGATYTVDQQNNMSTTAYPSAWGTITSAASCWIMRKGDSC